MLMVKEISMDLDSWLFPWKTILGFWGIAPEKTDTSKGGVVARQLQHNQLLFQDALRRWATLVATRPSL